MTGWTINEIDGASPVLDEAFDIRRTVFCREQGIAEALEIDGEDRNCRHYLVREGLGGSAIATTRVMTLGESAAKIQRVAVLKPYRGQGVGEALMRRTIDDLRARGFREAVVHAQTYVEAFYRRLGFLTQGDGFEEAGIPHVHMTLEL